MTLYSIAQVIKFFNHPYFVVIASSIFWCLAIFVLQKNPKNGTNKSFFFMNFLLGCWFFFHTLSIVHYHNVKDAFFWFRIGYSFIPFVSYHIYNFYLHFCKKQRDTFSRMLFIAATIEVSVHWLFPYGAKNAVALPFVGVYWKGFPLYACFLIFGAIKYVTATFFTSFSFWQEYRKETNYIRKQQEKMFAVIFLMYFFGAIEFIPAFGIPMYVGAFPVLPMVVLFAYAVAKFRSLEIDTVIHRTMLWLLTSVWLVIPAYLIFVIIFPWLTKLGAFYFTIIELVLFYMFLLYYHYFQPKIDHLFRRRKYDYHTVLGKVAEKLATTIDIIDLAQRLLTEVCETMYLRNSIFYIKGKSDDICMLMARRGYQEKDGTKQKSIVEFFTKEHTLLNNQGELRNTHPLLSWIREHQDVVEKDQVEINPLYEGVKDEILQWFKAQEIEVVVPLVLEKEIVGLLGLGKKENLQRYTAKDLELLKKLGEETGVAVFNALHYEDLAEQERLVEELRLGREIQENLLPKVAPSVEGLKVVGMMVPAKEIGGDYYDYIVISDEVVKQTENSPIGNGKLAIIIGDVSGKGVSAGLIMATAKATLKGISEQGLTPKEILVKANHILQEYTQGQKFMTMLYLEWDALKRKIRYSSAGHEHIIICRSEREDQHTNLNKIEVIPSGGIVLGMFPSIEQYLEDKELTLHSGDKIVLYTDGVTEAHNEKEELYELSRLTESVRKHGHKSIQELMAAIKDEIYTFIGSAEQYDDITIVVMEAE